MALTLSVEEIVEQSKSPLLGIAPGWKRMRLGDIATIQNGAPFKSELFNKEGKGMPVIRIRDVGTDGTDTYYSGEYDPAYVVRAGDLLIGMDGDFNCARWKGPDALLNQRVCRILPKTDKYEPRLMDHALPGYLKAINEVTSSVTVKHLSSKTVADIPLPLPPLPQQRRIVEAIELQLGRLDVAVARLQGAKARLKRYKQAVLKAAVEGALVELEYDLTASSGIEFQHASELLKIADETDVGQKRKAGRMWGSGHVPVLTDEERDRLPEGWVWTKVRALGYSPEDAVQVGPMSMKSEDFRDEGTPVLNVGCVKWGEFDETKLNYLPEAKASEFDRYRIKQGDVLFTRSGTVGRCAVAQAHQDGWLMTFHLLRARTNPKKCLPDYLRTVFEGAPHILRQTKDASIGSTRAGFNTNLLAELDVPLPPMREQVRIVAAVEQAMERVRETEASLDAQLQQAVRLRQAVLKRAFEGRLG